MAMIAETEFEAPMALWPFAVLLVTLGIAALLLLRKWNRRI
jgi:hypothetical protein